MKVALAYNVKTAAGSPEEEAEWDDAETIRAVERAISTRHDVVLIEAGPGAPAKFLKHRPDLVFNMAEGRRGSAAREAQIPAVLELLQIPYTGSGPLTLVLCLDKQWTKDALAAEEVPAPASYGDFSGGLRPPRNGKTNVIASERSNPFPLVVKPRREGSSIGIKNSSLVLNPEELERESRRIREECGEPPLVEEFLPGREFTVALIGNGKELLALPIVEVRLDALPEGARPIYSFEAKWEWDTPEKPLPVFDCPAKIPVELAKKIEETAKKAFRVLGCRDWARIDLRLDAAGEPRVIEVNPLPGILPDPKQNSCFPKAARGAGLTYERMVLKVLDAAARRCGLKGAVK